MITRGAINIKIALCVKIAGSRKFFCAGRARNHFIGTLVFAKEGKRTYNPLESNYAL